MRTLRIRVSAPVATPQRYEFSCVVNGQADRAGTTRQAVARWFASKRGPLRFGFRAINFEIRHAPLWDSVFPLLYLTRQGGPVFNKGYERIEIAFTYPVVESVARFFERRAVQLGFQAVVHADTYSRRFDLPTRGQQIAFGGGKDSRLLLGVLRELGYVPSVLTGGRKWPQDIEGVLRHEPINGTLTERIMPSLMSGSADVYLGCTLTTAMYHTPWHQYYDWGSPQGRHELSAMLRSAGVEIGLHGPSCILPSNVVQMILHRRYPALAKGQQSVSPNVASEKQLHIALIKLYHGLPIGPACSDQLFTRLLRTFVERKLTQPGDFGFHNAREIPQREMMAIICRLRHRPVLRNEAARVPPDWDARWIDYVHSYVDPHVEPAMLDMFHEYAPEYRPGPGDFRVRTPDAGSLHAVLARPQSGGAPEVAR